ncbi:hypothetical protein [Phenylobacterium sp.]|uniref:hypothetical protein n=1 Tax=Phenylobacterium sp. TaxID=1871053 RepID=UPI00120BACDC|nr:hypothetical protein [Phenylobacterium sp.]THD58557.1 MAG: hypothetical protein E8A49_18710 [Phenylobacterium sp.]
MTPSYSPWPGVWLGFGIGLAWLLFPKVVIAVYSALGGKWYRGFDPLLLRILSIFPLALGLMFLLEALRAR